MAKARVASTAVEETPPPIEDGEFEMFTPSVPTSEEPAPSGKFPYPKHRRLTEAAFFEYLSMIPSQEWGHLAIYIYRNYPVIDRRLSDKDNYGYIDKVKEPFDRQWLLTTHGTGEYGVKLSDSNKNHASAYVAETTIKFNAGFGEYPPVINMKELVREHKDNRVYVQWLITQGQLKQDGDGGTVATTAGEKAADFLLETGKQVLRERMNPSDLSAKTEATTMNKVVDMLGTAYNKALEIQARPPQSGDMSSLSELANVLKSLGLGSGSSQAELIQLLMKTQGDNMKLMVDMLSKQTDTQLKGIELQIQAQKTAGGSSVVEQIKGFAEVIAILHETGILGGGGGKADWKSSLIETVGEMIPKGISATANLIHNLAIFKGLKPGAVPVNPITGEPQPPGEQAALAPPAQPTAPGIDQDSILQIGGLVLDAIHRDMPGDEWGAGFISMHGRATYDSLQALGKDALLSAMQQVPQLWKQFEPIQPALQKFMDGFLQAGAMIDKENQGGDDED